MLQLILIYAILQHLLLVSCSPIQSLSIPKPGTTVQKRGWNADELQGEFRGIWWEEALLKCKPEQVNKLVYATRYATKMLDNVGLDFPYTNAYGRYFGPYRNWLGVGQNYLNLASQVHSMYLKSSSISHSSQARDTLLTKYRDRQHCPGQKIPKGRKTQI